MKRSVEYPKEEFTKKEIRQIFQPIIENRKKIFSSNEIKLLQGMLVRLRNEKGEFDLKRLHRFLFENVFKKSRTIYKKFLVYFYDSSS